MTKRPHYESVWDLPRNDIEACRQFWRDHELTGEDWRIMLRLQDDPAKLIAASERWSR